MAELSVLGECIAVDDPLEAYNKYRRMLFKEAEQAVISFRESYLQNKSLDEVIGTVPAQMAAAVTPAVACCIRTLVDHDVLDIDSESFCAAHPKFLEIMMEPYVQLYDKYAEIVMNQQQLDEYRTARRQGRARWYGSGFGLEGALKGAATAEVLNIATGAGYMMVNGIGKVFSSIGADMQKDKLLRDGNTYKSLEAGVRRAVEYLHLPLIDCLALTGVDQLPRKGLITEEQRREVRTILNNVELISDNNRCRSVMLNVFLKDPYSEKWYITALKRFGDQDGSLDKAADYFGVGVIRAEKAARLDAMIRSLPLNTEAETAAALEKIRKEKELLCFTGETSGTRKVQEAADRFDLEYRTVDGIVFDSRDEAAEARAELGKIIAIENSVDPASLSSVTAALHQISGYVSPVAAKHREKLAEKQNALDEQLRTVKPSVGKAGSVLCGTPEEAEELRRLDSDWYRRLAEISKIPDNEDLLKEMSAQVEASTCREEFKDFYLSAIRSELTKIDLKARTVLGKEYPTRDAAEAAKEQYNRIKAGIAAPDIKKKAFLLRGELLKADFAEEIRKELSDELFQAENAPEIKVARTISNIATALLLAILIASYLMEMRGTWDFASKRVEIFGNQLLINNVEITDSLNFLDGAKNGLIVFGRSFGGIFVNGAKGYIAGFAGKNLLSGALWAFLGLVWVIIKEVLLFFARYFVSLFTAFCQKAGFTYYLGYLVGSAIPLAASNLIFDDDNQRANVERIKGWNGRKILLTVLVVIVIGIISLFIISQET